MFGQPNTFGGGFGQPQQQQQQNTTFGTSPFGGGGATTSFGQPQQQPQQQGGFGTSTPFGSSTGSGFGMQQGVSPFGGGGGGTGSFGQTNTFGSTSTFGSPTPAPSGLFGMTPAPSGFGTTSTFGSGTSGGLFGSSTPNTGGGLFGNSSTNPSTTTSYDGMSFGSGTSSFGRSTFGSTTPAFGAPAPSGGLFGAAPAPSLFGAPAPSSGLFGSPAPPPSGSLFGSPAPQQQPLQGQGTRNTPWQPSSRQDGTAAISIHAISAMPAYENFSAEELRVQDYQQGNRGTTATPTASNLSGGFGFGGAPAPAFGAAPSSGLFGSAPAPAFGAPAPSVFGAPAPSGGLFGSTTSSFGAPAPSTSGLFGAPASTPFGAPATGSIFGSTPAPAPFGAPPGGGGLFGSPPSTSTFGAPSSTAFGAPSTFGAPAPSTGGLFGSSTPATSTFGSTFGSSPAPSTGLFGSAPAPAFGTPAPAFGFGARPPGTSVFGSPQPAPAPFGNSFGTFGQAPAPFGAPSPYATQNQYAPPMPAQQQPSIFPSNAVIIPPVENEVLEHQLRALENQRKEFERTQFPSASTPRSGTSPSTPLNLSDRDGNSPILHQGRFSYTPFSLSSPSSVTKIRPRGVFPKSEPRRTSDYTIAGHGMGQNASRTPEAHLRSYATHLVIKPKSSLKLRLESSFAPSPPQDSNLNNRSDELLTSDNLTSPSPVDDSSRALPAFELEKTPITEAVSTPQKHMNVNGDDFRVMDSPKSPAYDYYQRVIGSGEETSSLLSIPPSNESSLAKPRGLPKLTKNGYSLVPTLDELSNMSEADLAAVEGFTVKRASYGKIEWEGAVDVRNADLDSIIEIQQSDISVYHNNESNGSKPPVGSKLNRPAVLTFYNVFPKNGGASADADVKQKLREKLIKVSKRANALFLSYDDNIGEWKIRVQHFSRYGLIDDSEEEEDAVINQETVNEVDIYVDEVDDDYVLPLRRVRIETPHLSLKKQRKDVRQLTPYRPSRYSLSDDDNMDVSYSEEVFEKDRNQQLDDDDGAAVSVSDVDLTESDINEVVKANADIAYREVFESINTENDESEHDEQNFDIIIDIAVSGDEDEDSQEEEETATRISLKHFANFQSSSKSYCQEQADQRGLFREPMKQRHHMAKSFRVGWLPNGSFYKIDHQRAHPQTFLVRYTPIFVKDASLYNADALLDVQLRHVQLINLEDNTCPLYALPRCRDNSNLTGSAEKLSEVLKDFACQKIENQDSGPVFELLSEFVYAAKSPSLDLQDVSGQNDTDLPLTIRSVTSVSNWLAKMCASDVDIEVADAIHFGEPHSALLAALSCGDLSKAGEVAIELGEYDLATVLSTSSEGRKDVLMQLLVLAENEELSRLAPDLVRNLKYLGGDTHLEVDLHKRDTSQLDWRRYLAIRMMNASDKNLADIMDSFQDEVEAGKIPPPLALHCENTNCVEISLLYKVLQLFTNPSMLNLPAVVDPKGFTSYIHDFSMSFHLTTAISAMSLDSDMFPLFNESLSDGYECQLISDGHWELAVFVSLCLIGDPTSNIGVIKTRRAKNILLQHFDDSEASAEKRLFLESKLGIPTDWFSEALASRYTYLGDYERAVDLALVYDFEQALRLIEYHFLPSMLFLDDDAMVNYIQLVKHVAVHSPSDSLTVALNQLIDLKDGMSMLQKTSSFESRTQACLLLEMCEKIENTLLRYRTKPRISPHVGPDGYLDVVQLREMVSEALKIVKMIKFALLSMANT